MITTTKEINLAQLDAELGSHGLNMEDDGTTKTISAIPDSPVTDALLQFGIDAHVAVFPPDAATVKAQAIADARKLGWSDAMIAMMIP